MQNIELIASSAAQMPSREAELHPVDLRKVFERNRDRPWIFLRPLGNWGDQLLYAGAQRMATAAGLRWESCETFDFAQLATTPEHCIYLQGGGGFNNWCSGRAFANLEQALKREVHLVVQGPATVAGDLAWLKQRLRAAFTDIKAKQVLFFAREVQTLNLLRELALPAHGLELALDHDTALSLSVPDLLELAGLDAMPTGRYDMIVLRADDERPAQADAGVKSLPLSTANRAIALDPAYEASTFRHWIRMHLFARSIASNRLHSSILGALAGKPIYVGAGSYFKNKAVWQYSLAQRGVNWVDDIGRPAVSFWDRLPAAVRNSYKFRRLRLALHGVPLT